MRFIAAICLTLVSAATLWADNWPNWRGSDFNGVAVGTGYPTEWSDTQNIAWKVTLLGRGSSTPIVWDQNIFVTCGVDGQNRLINFDWQGKERWHLDIGKEKPGKNGKASGSNSSCTTDGNTIFAYFKSGELACVDFAGKIVWQMNLQKEFGEDTLWWDLGTSPVLTKNDCVVAVMQTGGSYLVALNKATGKVSWKVDRNLDAPEEAAQSYSTPVVVTENGEQTIVVLGADHVTAHSAADGHELWRVGGLNPTHHKYFRSIASPAVHQGIVVAPYGRGDSVTAIKLGGKGDVTSSHIAWTKKGDGPDVPTPAAMNGRAYILSDKGVLNCVEVATGKVIWTGQTEKGRKGFSSSPVLADGKIYLTREDGTTFVLAQGEEFKVLGTNELDGSQIVASPVFANGKILLRTDTTLYCVGK